MRSNPCLTTRARTGCKSPGAWPGTVTTLIQLFIAALVTFVAGRKRGILAG